MSVISKTIFVTYHRLGLSQLLPNSLALVSSLNHTMTLNLVILNFDDVNLRHSSIMKGRTDCIYLLYTVTGFHTELNIIFEMSNY